jgi:hypothetical protein
MLKMQKFSACLVRRKNSMQHKRSIDAIDNAQLERNVCNSASELETCPFKAIKLHILSMPIKL